MTKRPRAPSTLADVAKRAGVSAQTVSNYLTGRNKPRPRTLERLEAAIEELNYHPNAAARSLRSRRSNVLAILFEEPEYSQAGAIGRGLQEPLHMQFLCGAASKAREHGRHIMTVLAWRGETYTHASRLLQERRADGLIFSSEVTTEDRRRELRKLSRAERAPIVLLQERVTIPGVYTVAAQDELGAKHAAQHLTRLGHRHVAVLGTEPLWPGPVRRATAFVKEAQRAGLDVEQWLAERYTIAAVRELAARKLTSEVTGIFTVNDIVAMAVIQQAVELGLDIPADCSVVGFNDLEVASYFRPAITTIRMPAFAMGERAAEILIRSIDGGKKIRSASLPVELVVRDTTGPAPAQRRPRRQEGSIRYPRRRSAVDRES